MRRSALVLLDHPAQVANLLAATACLLARTGGGQLCALAIRTPALDRVLPTEEVLLPERIAAFADEARAHAERLCAKAREWEARAPADVAVRCESEEGEGADIVAARGGRADLIVLTRPEPHEPAAERSWRHAAIFRTGTPVLLVPPSYAGGALGGVIAVAWKNAPASERAVHAALPWLARAGSVHVLQAGHPPEMPPVLAEHGVAAALSEVPASPDAVGEALLRAAHGCGADMMVMGAFGRAPWREAVFGGVTRTLLAGADLPLFVRH